MEDFIKRLVSSRRTRDIEFQRTEYLGDKVLALAVATYIYQTLPSLTEGEISQLAQAIVSNSNISSFVRQYVGDSRVISVKSLADEFEYTVGKLYTEKGPSILEDIRPVIVQLHNQIKQNDGQLDWTGRVLSFFSQQKIKAKIEVS